MSLKKVNWVEDYDGLFEKEVPWQLLQNPLLQKEIWLTKEDLGLEIHEHNKILTLNFSLITQSWLKILAKLYILTRVNGTKSPDSLQHEIGHIKRLSTFLTQKQINNPKYLDSQLFEEFDNWIRRRKKKLSERTIGSYYSTLNKFFTTCRLEKWLEINTYCFPGKSRNLNQVKNDEIDYIPEEVWNQIEEHLHHFAAPMQRKVLIIRTLGLRIGELLNLPWDCLRKRDKQWRLRLKETEKFKIEDELPVPLDLVPVIKEQQEYIKKHFGREYKKLFCSNDSGHKFNFIPTARVMNIATFNRWLNRLANQYNICSKDRRIWHFTSHQFRRTVGTIMTNAGVRDLIIQKYLRHRNPDMQRHYKHLLKEVIGDEYQKLIKEKNLVNMEGKLVATHKPQDAIEEYMRLRLHQITTQQGECHRSNLKKPCPIVNGCWRCRDWMTSEMDLPYLKQDLERLKSELEKANKLGLVRVAKEIQKDINYLQIRINTLEEIINND